MSYYFIINSLHIIIMKLLFFIVSHFLVSSEIKNVVGNSYKKRSKNMIILRLGGSIFDRIQNTKTKGLLH